MKNLRSSFIYRLDSLSLTTQMIKVEREWEEKKTFFRKQKIIKINFPIDIEKLMRLIGKENNGSI